MIVVFGLWWLAQPSDRPLLKIKDSICGGEVFRETLNKNSIGTLEINFYRKVPKLLKFLLSSTKSYDNRYMH